LSSVVQQTIAIDAVQMQQGDLAVGGTSGNDNIQLKAADAQGGIRVTINGVTHGTFIPSGHVLVYAQPGDDSVQLATTKIKGQTYYVQSPAVIFGGEGDDTLDARGSSADNVLSGGGGADVLYGGIARDILMGGLGADTLRGGQGEDVLIGNSTIYDNHLAALLALMAEWRRSDADYATRAAHLQGAAGGLNGDAILGPSTILDDGAVDQLYGESGLDLFFATAAGAGKDKLNDLAQGELNVEL
jgi:Ca2+-binding RTX toxin-like protein